MDTMNTNDTTYDHKISKMHYFTCTLVAYRMAVSDNYDDNDNGDDDHLKVEIDDDADVWG